MLQEVKNQTNVKRILTVEEKWYLLFRQAEGPPMYRPEEYIFHLRKWFTDAGIPTTDNRERDKKHRDGGGGHEEQNVSIVLTELLDISELLRNLKFDMKLAHLGFVAEFIREPHNGVNLLLDFLKTTQMGHSERKEENNNHNNGTIRSVVNPTKKSLADEYECLLSLKHASRYQETLKRIMEHPSGVFLIASCALSNFMKSRIVALELLIKTCELGTEGHNHVEKAMCTLRLRYGEPVRFKFLIGMLNSPGNKALTFQAYCLSFLNKLLETSKNICKRVYLQCEIEEAGLDTRLLQKFTEYRDYVDQKVYVEAFRVWKRNYVDVESLVTVSKRLTSDNKQLRGELEKLKEVTKKLEEDKMSLMTIEKELSEQCAELEQKVTTLSKSTNTSQVSDQTAESKQCSIEGDIHENLAPSKTSTGSLSPSPQPKGSDAMSISSEESPKSGGSKEAKDNDHHQQDVDPEHDVIVPTIQRRRPKYVWPNRNNDSLRLRSNGRDDLFQHLESGIRVRLCKNDNRAADPFQNVRTGCYDDIALNWSYPAVPLPIAVVTSGKSSLQDMSANINDRYKSPLNSDGNLSDHRNVSLDFHKALFQRSYPVPSTEKITRTFHV